MKTYMLWYISKVVLENVQKAIEYFTNKYGEVNILLISKEIEKETFNELKKFYSFKVEQDQYVRKHDLLVGYIKKEV